MLSHKMSGNAENLVFASRSLAVNERNYLKLDKEALGVLFDVKRFHTYIHMYFYDHKSS